MGRWTIALLALTAWGAAQAQTIGGGGEARPVTSCVDVRIGDARAYDCINRQLQAVVPPRRTDLQAALLGADAPAHQAGTFNFAATQQMLGNSFGRSVNPQREPRFDAVGSGPLGAGRLLPMAPPGGALAAPRPAALVTRTPSAALPSAAAAARPSGLR